MSRKFSPMPPMSIVVDVPYDPSSRTVHISDGVYPLDALRKIVEEAEPRTCTTCKHWQENACARMYAEDGEPCDPKSLAHGWDRESVCAKVYTEPTFSCNQWEAR